MDHLINDPSSKQVVSWNAEKSTSLDQTLGTVLKLFFINIKHLTS